MCSLQPSQDPVKDSQDSHAALSQTTLCCKCKQAKATINIRFAVYCDACFLEQTFHKFRVAVGKSRRRNDREHILLYLDMSPSRRGASLVLLGLVAEQVEEERNNVNTYSVCLFEDTLDGAAFGICTKYGIPIYRLDQQPQTQLQSTAAQDQHANQQIKTIAGLYKQINADKLYLPDTCNDLAAVVFKLMIKGGGEVVPWELQPVKRWFGMNVVRPLREHHVLEVTEYNRLHNGYISTTDQSHNHKSLNDLTDSFFATLDQDYSATVSTVTKTGLKVSSSWSEHQDTYKDCLDCGCPTRQDDTVCHSCAINRAELLLNN